MYAEQASNEQLYLNWVCQCMLNFSPMYIAWKVFEITWSLWKTTTLSRDLTPCISFISVSNPKSTRFRNRILKCKCRGPDCEVEFLDHRCRDRLLRISALFNLAVVSYAGVPNAKSSLNSGALIHSYLNLSRIILSNFRSCRTTVQVAHGSSTKSIFRVCRTSVCVELQHIYLEVVFR